MRINPTENSRARLVDFAHEIRLRDGFKPPDVERLVTYSPAKQVVSSRSKGLLGTSAESARVWDRLSRNLQLSQKDYIHLESIILPALRPAFDIENDSYQNLPADWQPLNDHRTQMEQLIKGIGRIDLVGHPSLTFVGTGFICSDTCLMTNRHVAQIFTQIQDNGNRIIFSPGISSSLNLKEEVASQQKLSINLIAPKFILDTWDIAIFEIEAPPSGVGPLTMASKPPADIGGGFAAIVGYPAFDSSESFVDQATIFRSVFDKKRLQPGKTIGLAQVESYGRDVEAIAHDCSTLGGNSGSALIDVGNANVIGIHFAGITHKANYAVPTWQLLAEPRIKELNLNFA